MAGPSEAPLRGGPAVTADVVKQVAAACGLTERRTEASSTLYFHSSALSCDYDVYYTTRSLRTQLIHPKQGENSLWRSDTYGTVAELAALFRNPRVHTDKGYRRAGEATRDCTECGKAKKRTEYSDTQWKHGPDRNKCKDCVAANRRRPQAPSDVKVEAPLEDALEHLSLSQAVTPAGDETEGGVRSEHGVKSESVANNDGAARGREEDGGPSTGKRGRNNRGGRQRQQQDGAKLTEANVHKLEIKTEPISRRQFRCPMHGVYFKKVPDRKPVSTCKQCRNGGSLLKWAAVPREQEKGFGLFRCPDCGATWGSSKACRSLGQFCMEPQCTRGETPVFPFRILPERRPRRAKENIDETKEHSYAHEAFRPFYPTSSGGGFGGGFYEALQEYEDKEDISAPGGDDEKAAIPGDKEPPPTRHRCTGCAAGLCRDRKVPLSMPHDSTGSTATSCSDKTWSTASGLGNYADRDAE